VTSSPALGAAVRGRLAVAEFPSGRMLVAAGAENGMAAVFDVSLSLATATTLDAGSAPLWPRQVSDAGFAPDFLWIDFGPGATGCDTGLPQLVAHHADWLWAFCAEGRPLPGWGRDVGDTLIAGLAAGDPDGDGFPELLTQSLRSQLTYWNVSGYPSPGWPRRATDEDFRSGSPPLAVDWDDDGVPDVTAMNASGIVAALGGDGHVPAGFPLATGLGAAGSALGVSLDRNASVELVVPDARGVLYGYSVPTAGVPPLAAPWTMVGGDPGRTCSLPAARTPTAPAATAGPLESGSLRAYPNPARRRPVSFAYRLTEPANVEFRIVDASGHEVASFTRPGRQSDNLEVWDPGSLPAGLYVARISFKGSSDHVELVPVGILK